MDVVRIAAGLPHAFATAVVAMGLAAHVKDHPRAGRVRVVATVSPMADLAATVGGDRVEVVCLSDPRENPHRVKPTPTLMRRARNADLFVEVGLELDPWANKVIDGSGNPRIQDGQPGHVIASRGIATLEVPERISRERGDIHPFGNPYVWLDPLNAKRMAANIVEGLARVDSTHAAEYRARLGQLEAKIDEALFGAELVRDIGAAKLGRLARQGRLAAFLDERKLTASLGGWLATAEPLRGREIVSYHKTWAYFAARFGLVIPIEIEELPGMPPSTRHRASVLEVMQERGMRSILMASYYDRRAADHLAERTGATVVVVPIGVGPEVGVSSYFDLIDTLLERLVAAEKDP